jgi:tetratricopeptide (TPR) repeat protein
VLYELLTGQRPHQFKDQSVVEIERVICHEEPERPSSVVSRDLAMVRGLRFLVSGPWQKSRDRTQRLRDKLRRELTGDLDNIVLMAMRKEPERRYRSVEQLAEDLRRYLDGEPVTARQDTLGYRVGKFVRRNKFPVAAVVLIMSSLVGGIVMTARQARRAEQRFEEVRKLANTFLFEVHDKIKELPGATEARELVVKTALGYLDNLARDTAGDRSLQLELAQAYEKVGDVQGSPGGASLGQAGAALQSYRKALEIEEKLAADDPTNLEVLRSLSKAYYKVGDQQVATGNVIEAIESFRRGLSVATTVHEAEPDDPESDYLLIEGYLRLGDGQVTSRDVAGALRSFQTGLTIITHLANEQTSDRTQMLLAVGRERIGSILTVMGDLSGALASYRQALGIRETLFSNQPTNPTHRRNLVAVYQHMGDVLGSPSAFSLGDERAALEYYRKALVIAEEIATADPKDAAVRHNLAVLYTKLGNVLRDANPRQGAEMYRISLDLMKPLLGAAPEDLLLQRSQSRNYLQLAYPLWKLGDYQGAMASLRQALDMQEAMIAKDPARKTTRQDMLVSFNMMGDVEHDMNDPTTALESYRKALAIAETLLRENPSDSYTRRDLSDCYERLGRFYAGQATRAKSAGSSRTQSWREARAWYQKSLSIWNEWTKWSVANAYSARRQQEASRALAECEAALARLDAAAKR